MDEPQQLGIREVRNDLGNLVDLAHYRSEHTIITRNDQPRAVLVPYDWWKKHFT